jgi:hypothetical protein
MTPFWQIVIGSPALRARAREFDEELEDLVTTLFAEAGHPRPRMTVTLALAAYRVCYLEAARRIMSGEPSDSFFPEQRARVARAFDQAAVAAAAVDPG